MALQNTAAPGGPALGLDVLYLQAKKWDGTVGRPELQKFVGALHGKLAKKGVFITTGSFSDDAIAYVKHVDSEYFDEGTV